MRPLAGDLHLLMSLASQQNDVSGVRLSDCRAIALCRSTSTVYFVPVLGGHQRIVDDGAGSSLRGLSEVERRRSRCRAPRPPRRRTLGAIPIASTTKHGYDPGGSPAPRTNSRPTQVRIPRSIVRVGIVDNDCEGLPAIDAFRYFPAVRHATASPRAIAAASQARA